MYHSIMFGDKNTWTDWHLIPSSRPVITPPAPKLTYIEVPGAHGSLDYSEVLCNEILYSNRSGSIEFIVDNDHEPWFVIYSNILNYLQGKQMRMVLEDDPSYYYIGRFAVNDWKSDQTNSIITIDYNVDPYKYCIFDTGEDWKWNPFNFLTDKIQNLKNKQISGSGTLYLYGDYKKVAPTIVVSGLSGSSISLSTNGKTYVLKSGNNYFPEMIMSNGKNTLSFTGTATVTVKYRGARL